MVNTNQNFPGPNVPLVDERNYVTPAWLKFLLNLWNRTGAAQGGTTSPVGMVAVYGGAGGIPEGWAECDGAAISRVVFARLFLIIGTTWGIGDGTTTFNLPDFRDRFLIGASFTKPTGTTGGANSITLSTAQLPAHKHSITDPGHLHTVTDPGHIHTITDPQHTHGVTDPQHAHTTAANAANGTTGTDAVGNTAGSTGSAATGITIQNASTGISINSYTTGLTVDTHSTGITETQNTGSGAAIDTTPAYAAARYMIKT